MYTPPSGDSIAIVFVGAYTVPMGDSIEIPFGDLVPVPTAVSDSYSTLYHSEISDAAPGFLSNDTLNGATVSLESSPSHAESFTFGTDGSFDYTPAVGFSGTDSFTYKLQNIWGDSIGTVSITVAPIPAPPRYTYTTAGLPWGKANPRQVSVSSSFRVPPSTPQSVQVRWNRGTPVDIRVDLPWKWSIRVESRAIVPWGRAAPVNQQSFIRWESLPRITRSVVSWWSVPPSLHVEAILPYKSPSSKETSRLLPWGVPNAHQLSPRVRWKLPHKKESKFWWPWGHGKVVQWVVHDGAEDNPPDDPHYPPFYVPPEGDRISIPFICRWHDVPGDQIAIPFGIGACYGSFFHPRVITVLNSVVVVRLPERTPIPVSGLNLESTADSPYWALTGMTLSDPAYLDYLLADSGGMKEIEVTLNGWKWIFQVETDTEDREFNQRGVTVTGRSRTALLAEPSAPRRSFIEDEDRLSVQLMDQELELLYSEFEIEHEELSWLVPGNTWNYESYTPMEAIQAVAASSGSIVLSDPFYKKLVVRPRYPVSPWNWGSTAADYTIQDDVVTRISRSNKSLPKYNYVFVSGTVGGVGDPVIREGSAGDIKKPMVTDLLITTHPVALERGRNELSDYGEQSLWDVRLPLFPIDDATPGVIPVGKLVNYIGDGGSWKGLNIATHIEVTTDSNGLIEIWVTNSLERNYTDEG